jgi:hypothetical protein
MRCTKPVLALAALLLATGCGSAMARPESPKDCDGGNVKDCQSQCQGGVGRACYRLAWFTEEGESGVSKNPKEAVRLYDQACQAKMAVACRALGIIYARGADDVEPNRKRSREYFQQACTLGIPEVCPPPEKKQGGSAPPPQGAQAEAQVDAHSSGSSGSSGGSKVGNAIESKTNQAAEAGANKAVDSVTSSIPGPPTPK